jgi:hypothetical protein
LTVIREADGEAISIRYISEVSSESYAPANTETFLWVDSSFGSVPFLMWQSIPRWAHHAITVRAWSAYHAFALGKEETNLL